MVKRVKKGEKKVKIMAKGFNITALPKQERHAGKKGRLANRTKMIREVIRDISGFAPYEKKMIELLQIGGAAEGKKALKIAK
jgi:large subunit ribosomal protein L36e